jgi:hypothetical protein
MASAPREAMSSAAGSINPACRNFLRDGFSFIGSPQPIFAFWVTIWFYKLPYSTSFFQFWNDIGAILNPGSC